MQVFGCLILGIGIIGLCILWPPLILFVLIIGGFILLAKD
jgi:hypothetical protein